MSVLSERIAAAKSAPREKCDPVEVLLDGDVVQLVFEQVPGDVWGSVTAKHPAVGGGLIALRYGYDVHKVVRSIAPLSGFVLVDGVESKLDYVKKKDAKDSVVEVDEWADLLDALDGHSFSLVADAVWYLNEWAPQQRIAAAKKA